ncbi:MAG TPA: AraC family transcriptional regulator [Stellaceae bacterium]|nr:AraC family transcriptional regulator [Stellaceae bacterium]
MTEQGAYITRIGEYFGLKNPPTLTATISRKAKLTITRLRSDSADHAMTKTIPRESAFIVALQLRDLRAHELWMSGRPIPVTPYAKDTISAVDLDFEPTWHLKSPFDLLHFYLPSAALDEIATQNASGRVDTLSIAPGAALLDPVVRQLGSCFLPELERPERASSLFVDHVAHALTAHLAHTYGGMRFARPLVRGGLAPWQERRAKEYMTANLEEDISLAQLASECSLSLSYFARAFRQSTGQPPHRWRLERRVDRAKDLLLNSTQPLAEIALACGFADQSHFTRVFSRIVGVGPAAWRRAQGSMWKYVPPREVSASEAKSSRSGCSPRAIPWNSQREIEARV